MRGSPLLRLSLAAAALFGVAHVAPAEQIEETGPDGAVILRYAKRRKVDLIVLGTRGLSQMKGVLMGSVSRKVTNLSEISCLIVR